MGGRVRLGRRPAAWHRDLVVHRVVGLVPVPLKPFGWNGNEVVVSVGQVERVVGPTRRLRPPEGRRWATPPSGHGTSLGLFLLLDALLNLLQLLVERGAAGASLLRPVPPSPALLPPASLVNAGVVGIVLVAAAFGRARGERGRGGRVGAAREEEGVLGEASRARPTTVVLAVVLGEGVASVVDVVSRRPRGCHQGRVGWRRGGRAGGREGGREGLFWSQHFTSHTKDLAHLSRPRPLLQTTPPHLVPSRGCGYGRVPDCPASPSSPSPEQSGSSLVCGEPCPLPAPPRPPQGPGRRRSPTACRGRRSQDDRWSTTSKCAPRSPGPW